MISCILLSAGLNSRFGSPKALARINHETVIEHTLNTLAETNIDETIIVLGAFATQIRPTLLNHRKIKLVYNKDYNFGQTSSLRAGLKHISKQASGFMLLPIDFPFVKSQTIGALIKYFQENKPLIIVPTFNNKKGHPPLFDIQLREEFLQLDNAVGLNTIAHRHEKEVVSFPVNDQGVIGTFNTIEEFERLKVELG